MSKRAKFQEGGFVKKGLQTLGVIDEEGEIDPVQAALLGLTFVPGLGLVGAGARIIASAKGLASLIKAEHQKQQNLQLGKDKNLLLNLDCSSKSNKNK